MPANFDQRQRHATMEAAKLAGIEVMQLLNEPTAVAIAYGLHNKGKNKVLVYDFGGGNLFQFQLEIRCIICEKISLHIIKILGTLDVSIVMCEGNNVIKVLATSGHNHLGILSFSLQLFS